MSQLDFFDYLQDRFPEMQRVKEPPSLFTVNGIGTTVYGARDHDHESGTYVKTMVFCVVFIPIFATTAYRVADAPNGGWYFLGKVPLSPLARNWNWITLVCLLLGVGLLFLTAR